MTTREPAGPTLERFGEDYTDSSSWIQSHRDQHRLAAIVAQVPDDADRILDVGCVRHDSERRARGNLHARLHDAYPDAEIVGIDVDGAGIAEMDRPGYDLREMDAEALEFDAQFDAIVAGELVEHLSNPGWFFAGAREYLPRDGVLVLSTPNPWALARVKNAIAGRPINPEHTCWMDERTLRQHLDRYGFDATVEYLPAAAPGLTRLLYRLGRERLGGSHLLVRATPEVVP